VTIIQAIEDANLFRPLFKNLDTWRAWLCVLRAVFALPMEEADRELFTTLTGRETPPTQQVDEAWIIAGRRAGKSRMAALIAVYLSCFKEPFRGHSRISPVPGATAHPSVLMTLRLWPPLRMKPKSGLPLMS
jgi:hypothetical protein